MECVHLHIEQILGPVCLELFLYHYQACFLNHLLIELFCSDNAVVVFVDHKASLSLIFFKDYEPVRVETISRPDQKLHCFLIGQIAESPLHPHTIILLFKKEVLHSHSVELSNVLVRRQVGLGSFNVLLALVTHVDLHELPLTVLYIFVSRSLVMRPMPAPQSNADSLFVSGCVRNTSIMNFNENLISGSLRLP